jgi:hypothetical protein
VPRENSNVFLFLENVKYNSNNCVLMQKYLIIGLGFIFFFSIRAQAGLNTNERRRNPRPNESIHPSNGMGNR